ncbi:glycerophosphodiester phosphodiesterase family protein [Echinicola vietnamensis]|uniref:Glycerophosphoryl diester phosphodiesterase n=1 Tax=Echinicola vietnamensis (strain DSM 17526 / LMG 23754 / KMM 6221) TaxID=926556 RepID=L0G5F1_ECHVK|nr:glycerophosphodiester phosphodiesterase family protein [Echinicola vietnamensis]AGA80777.1 glycerophosphoryl diester phosphodiesterase [Echinicola vietnamensis DSM 17526]
MHQQSLAGLCLLLIILFLGCGGSTDQAVTTDGNYLSFENVAATKAFFNWNADWEPMVSAHRGGSYPGYPENAIQTFDYVLQHTPALIECDISMTMDSVLVMMHDNTVDRTTSGSGAVSALRYEEIKAFDLEDAEGKVTAFNVPTLREVLEWAKGKAVLTLDIKSNVPYELVLEEINATGAEAHVVLITYSLGAAKKLHRMAPELMLSVTLRNDQEWDRFLATGIPVENIIAFTGVTARSAAFNEKLHQHGVCTILGTLGNLDKRAVARGDQLYQEFVNNGADILATDRPIEAANIISKKP